MLKGSRVATITKLQPVSVHGQISMDVHFADPDDPQAQVRVARIGPESIPSGLEPGDTVELHYVLGSVTHITRR